MENEKMQVNFAPGVTEATLRVIELHEENELPVLEPDKVELAGTIGSVHEFLLKTLQMWTGVIFDCPFVPLVQK